MATGGLSNSAAAQHSNVNVLGYKTIKKVKEIDVKGSGDREDFYCIISGCCFMQGGPMILCDFSLTLIFSYHFLRTA